MSFCDYKVSSRKILYLAKLKKTKKVGMCMTHHRALGRRPHHSSHWKHRRVVFLLVRRMSLVVIWFSANMPFFFSPSSLSSPQKITQYVGGVHAIQCPLPFGAARDSLQWSDCRRWSFDFPPSFLSPDM
jgi:hypothetical protein